MCVCVCVCVHVFVCVCVRVWAFVCLVTKVGSSHVLSAHTSSASQYKICQFAGVRGGHVGGRDRDELGAALRLLLL